MNLNEKVGDTVQCQWVSHVEESFPEESFPVIPLIVPDVAHECSGLIEPEGVG